MTENAKEREISLNTRKGGETHSLLRSPQLLHEPLLPWLFSCHHLHLSSLERVVVLNGVHAGEEAQSQNR